MIFLFLFLITKECLPVSLETLNISGNPCATDMRFIQQLQSSYPNLKIINDDIKEPEINEMQTMNSTLHNNYESNDANADEALRQIASRNCLLDGLHQYDIQPMLKVCTHSIIVYLSSGLSVFA